MINYISHKKSKQIVNGLPKLPTADQLKEGEIAINYANGYETLSIKNSDNKIITFSSTEQFEKYVDTTLGNKLGSGFTSGNSANTVTSVIESNEKVVSASLNDLNERKLDASAYTPTDLSDYYKKEETSGKTELDAALKLKANATDLATKANTTDLTAHTGNNDIHITSDERTKWNNAATSSHTHTNKDVLDTITAIDSELNENSKNLVVNSAITTVILENEKIVSTSLNDLNDRKLDINYTGFTGTTLSGVTSIIQAIQKIADKLDKTTTNS